MSKVTQEAFARRPRFDRENETKQEQPVEANEGDGGADDLKATVALSGEALAALLEEVKTAQAAAGQQLPPLTEDEVPQSPEPRRGPQRSGKA
jgi:hypothetical protein